MFCKQRQYDKYENDNFELGTGIEIGQASWMQSAGSRLNKSVLQYHEQNRLRTNDSLCGSLSPMTSTSTDKQFSIDSILGKDANSCLSPSSMNTSFYREMADFENIRRDDGRRMKAKRIRTIFTPEQLERMEDEFNKTQYMVGHDRVLLASRLNLSEAQVKVWFQNRRIKWRKQNQNFNQNKLEVLRSKNTQAGMNVKQEKTDSLCLDEQSQHQLMAYHNQF